VFNTPFWHIDAVRKRLPSQPHPSREPSTATWPHPAEGQALLAEVTRPQFLAYLEACRSVMFWVSEKRNARPRQWAYDDSLSSCLRLSGLASGSFSYGS